MASLEKERRTVRTVKSSHQTISDSEPCLFLWFNDDILSILLPIECKSSIIAAKMMFESDAFWHHSIFTANVNADTLEKNKTKIEKHESKSSK